LKNKGIVHYAGNLKKFVPIFFFHKSRTAESELWRQTNIPSLTSSLLHVLAYVRIKGSNLERVNSCHEVFVAMFLTYYRLMPSSPFKQHIGCTQWLP